MSPKVFQLFAARITASTCLTIAALVLVSCASGETADDAANVPAAPAAPTTAADASPSPTPTATASPTGTPTPAPRPTSVFERVVMPADMVGSRQHLLVDAHAPAGTFGWNGVGHRYDPTRGVSIPGTWAIADFDERASTSFSALPIPQDALGGNAWSTAVVGTHELAAGRVVHANGANELALWQRASSDTDWTRSDGTTLGLPSSEIADTWSSQLRGNEQWGLLLTGTQPFTSEAGAYRHMQSTKQLFRSVDGQDWQTIDLGRFDTDAWAVDFYIEGRHGLITATLDRDAAAASADEARSGDELAHEMHLLITTDAGVTWTEGEVALDADSPAAVRDAFFFEDTWVLAGSVGTEGSRMPAMWEQRNDSASATPSIWHRHAIEVRLPAEFADRDLEFAAMRPRSTGDFLAIVDTNRGSRTVFSEDWATWTDSERHWINRIDGDSEASLFTLVTSPSSDDRYLALRGFDSPVRIDKNGSRVINTDAFDANFRLFRSLVTHQESFVALVADTWRFDPQWSRVWRSDDGIEWTWIATENERVLNDAVSLGAQLLASLTVLDDDGRLGDAMLRTYDNEGQARTVGHFDLVPEAETLGLGSFMSAPAVGRPLLTTSAQGRVIFVFADPNLPGARSAFVVPDITGSTSAVCPELSSGEFAVALDTDDNGTIIEVWADREDPRLASGPLTVDGTAHVHACDRWGAGLALTGQLCPAPSERADSDTGDADAPCQAMLWSSPDGRAWTRHPQAELLADLGEGSVTGLAGSDSVVFFASEHSGEHALWLATSELLIEVPLHDAPHFDDMEIVHLTLSGDTLLVNSGAGLFVASRSSTIERIAADTGRDPSTISDSSPAWPQTEALVTSAGLTAPAATVELPEPAPTAAPTQPPQTAAPAPQPPAPTPSPAPAPTPVPAVPSAPDLAGNDDGTGTSITLTCTFTTDVDTGIVTEVCE